MAHACNARQRLITPAEMASLSADNLVSNREPSRERLRTLLFAGAQAEHGAPVDASYFDALRDRIKDHSNTANTLQNAKPRGPT